MSEVVRRRVTVRGRVQGVSFRYNVRREAQQRGVTGWVRNRVDGAVEAAFEGEPAAVAALVAFCERGPRGADVRAVEAVAERPQGSAVFEVR